jgi:putative CocE/NonD family hydrolase
MLLTFLVAAAVALGLAASPSRAAEAAPRLPDLCQTLKPASPVVYDRFFDARFRAVIPAERVDSIFRELTATHGECRSVDALSTRYPMLSPGDFGFVFKDGRQALFRVHFSPNSGLIDGLLYQGSTLPPENFRVHEERVAMRDGAGLRTFVFEPRVNGEFRAAPVVLQRTPYLNGDRQFLALHLATASYYLERGYAYVLQSIRGLHGSDGEALLFNPGEARDGADTVRWITRQTFSNGRVAAVGSSYDGFTALAAGIENPDGLRLIIAGAGPADSSTGTFNVRGLLNLSGLEYIHYFTTSEGQPFTGASQRLLQLAPAELDARRYDEILYGQALPEWKRWANAWADLHDPLWQERSLLKRLPEIAVPTYHFAGLREDGNMPDTLANFLEIDAHSPFRERHRLVLGSWDHDNNTPYGDGANLSPFLRARFDSLLATSLRDEPNPYAAEPRVQMESHFNPAFLGGPSYPPVELPTQTLYFHRDPDGVGRLGELPPGEAATPASQYRYDPTEALLTRQNMVFIYQAPVDLAINGPLEFRLFLALDVPQTDVAILVTRAQKPLNVDSQEFVTSCSFGGRVERTGDVTEFRSAPCPVFMRVRKGEFLVVQLVSNLFPELARNPNGAPKDFYSPRPATVRLLHNPARPSRLTMSLERAP